MSQRVGRPFVDRLAELSLIDLLKRLSALSVLRMIKLFSWEPFMLKRITVLRKEELKALRNNRLLNTAIRIVNDMLPLIAKLTTFTCYVSSGPAPILQCDEL